MKGLPVIAVVWVFAALLMVGIAQAEPSIQVNTDGTTYFQALHGIPGVDAEMSIKADDFFISSDGQIATGYAEAKINGVPLETVSWITEYGVQGTWSSGTRLKWTVKVNQADYPEITCTLQDIDGKRYDSKTWESLAMWQDNKRFTARAFCVDAVLQ